MRIMTQKFLAVCLVMAFPGLTHAFTIGELHSRTEVGQMLDAYIDLYMGPVERQGSVEVSVSRDIFADPSGAQNPEIEAIRASVEYQPGGYAYIHLQSTLPSNAAPLAFRVHIENGGRTLIKHYTFAARAVRPLVAPRLAHRDTAPRKIVKAEIAPVAVTRGPATIYGPVRAGESLWSIAQRINGGQNIFAMMKVIHTANPAAFVNGNINRLKLGVALTIPNTTSVINVQTEVAKSEVAPAADEAVSSTKYEDVIRTMAAEDSDPFAEGLGAKAKTPPVYQPTGRDPALTARLAALDQKYAAIRAKYSATKLPTASVAATAVAAQLQPTSTRNNPAELLPPAKVSPTEAASPTGAVVPVAAASSNRGIFLSLIAAALLAAALLARRFQILRRRQRVHVSVASSTETERKALVSQKAAVRMRLERDLRKKVEEKNHSPKEVSRPIVEDLLATLKLSPIAPTMAAAETDADIDSSIAHGRYSEAERLLQKVIRATPLNVAAKMRLAEVYYITERVADFSALAMDLQQNHRVDLSNEEWQRLQRMGKIVARDLPMFSGPRVVASKY